MYMHILMSDSKSSLELVLLLFDSFRL